MAEFDCLRERRCVEGMPLLSTFCTTPASLIPFLHPTERSSNPVPVPVGLWVFALNKWERGLRKQAVCVEKSFKM